MFNGVQKTNGLEAWHKLVVPLRPRSEAKRNALHTQVHAPPKSADLTVLMQAIVDWGKVVERFQLCGRTVTEADKKTVLLKLLPTGVSTDLVGALRGKSTYEEIKYELDDCIDFLQDHGFV